MKVEKWIPFEIEPEQPQIYHNDPNLNQYIHALRQEGRILTGDEHQHLEDGMPLFSDGKVMSLTFRGWGSVMAEAFGGNYIDYYM